MLYRFQQLRTFVLALSGVHEDTLRLVPTQRARFESLGWAVLITSCMAAISMWFALASAVGVNPVLAIPVALFWGLVIMGIDRWLITSMPAAGSRKLAMAVPRLALALLLGTLISTPLVLRIFQSEINAQIAVMQQASYTRFLTDQQASAVTTQVTTYANELQQVNKEISTHGAATGSNASDPRLVAYNKQLTGLDGQLTHWTNLKNQYYTAYTCQLYGGPACPRKGNGPAAKASHQSYLQAAGQVTAIKGQINGVQTEIQQRDSQLNSSSKTSQQVRYQQAKNQLPVVQAEYATAVQRKNELQAAFFTENQAAHGILIRLEALSALSQGNFTVTAARFLLFLLFLVIECLPVTVKLLQPPGLYEEALAKAEDAHRRDVRRAYSGRPRLGGGGGFPAGQQAGQPTAVLQLRPEPERPIDSIWNSTRVLTRGAGDPEPEDEPPTEVHGSHPAAGRHGWVGEYPAPGPGFRRPRPGRGPGQWRDHWGDSGDHDGPDEPDVATALLSARDRPGWREGPELPETRVDRPGLPDSRAGQPAADPLLAPTRLDYRYRDDLTGDADGTPGTGDSGGSGDTVFDHRPFERYHEDEPAGGTETGDWTPLSWDDEE